MTSKTNVDKSYILNAPLPNHGSTYTVISHKLVIDTTRQMLANSGFVITNEYYRANTHGQVAQGIYHIRSINDPNPDNELGMMFAWTNSYDKSIRFQCALGAYVMACSNGMVCGELNYARKHTGTAGQEIRSQISSQIKHAQKAFDRIKQDRDNLRSVTLTERQQAELLGRMFFNEDLISARQMSTVKDEMDKPSFDYKADQDNAWAFYNHVTHSYKNVHPRSWLSDTKKFHDFMTANVLTGMGITNTDTVNTDDIIDQDFQDNIDLESEEPNIVECSVPEGKEFNTPYEIPEDVQKEYDNQTRVEEGLDHKGSNYLADEEADDMKIDEIMDEMDDEDKYDFEI